MQQNCTGGKQARPRHTGPALPGWIARYWRPSQAGPAQTRCRNGRSYMAGTNAIQIWGRPAKRKAGNAHPPLRPKTEPTAVCNHRLISSYLPCVGLEYAPKHRTFVIDSVILPSVRDPSLLLARPCQCIQSCKTSGTLQDFASISPPLSHYPAFLRAYPNRHHASSQGFPQVLALQPQRF